MRPIQPKVTVGTLPFIALSLQLEPPVVDPHAGAVGLGVRQRKTGARGTLVVQQLAELRVGDRGMGKQQLARIERARIGTLLVGTSAKERDLEADRAVEPAGDVPPLGAKFRVSAMVTGKDELFSRNNFRVSNRL